MSREVNLIVVHSSATPPSMDIGAREIRKWHLDRGFDDIGYHNVIRRDGTLEHGRDLAIAGAHARGYNSGSIGVCMVGGVDSTGRPVDNFTDEQKITLRGYLDTMCEIFDAEVTGHGDLPNTNTDCPSFDVKKWYR